MQFLLELVQLGFVGEEFVLRILLGALGSVKHLLLDNFIYVGWVLAFCGFCVALEHE
jgi:hypothetical protein